MDQDFQRRQVQTGLYEDAQTFAAMAQRMIDRADWLGTVRVCVEGDLHLVPSSRPSTTDNYNLVFEDNFDQGTLDPDKWNTRLLWGPFTRINSENQIYIDTLDTQSTHSYNPFSFDTNGLQITAQRSAQNELPPAISDPNDPYYNDPNLGFASAEFHNYLGAFPNSSRDPWVPEFQSGAITTFDKFTLGPEYYVEYCTKVPKSTPGLFPANWQLHSDYQNADGDRFHGPEVDTLEVFSDSTQISHNYFVFDNSIGGNYVAASISAGPTAVIDAPAGQDWADAYHKYGAHRRPGQIDYYIDGVLTHSITGERVSDDPQYLLINLAMGAFWIPTDATTRDTVTMGISHVKVWQP